MQPAKAPELFSSAPMGAGSAVGLMAAPNSGRRQPDLLRGLDASARAKVLARGRACVFRRGQAVFRQGEPHDGIFLIESGLARVFYTAPAGREITLAYWMAGNFCGGPRSVWRGRPRLVRRGGARYPRHRARRRRLARVGRSISFAGGRHHRLLGLQGHLLLTACPTSRHALGHRTPCGCAPPDGVRLRSLDRAGRRDRGWRSRTTTSPTWSRRNSAVDQHDATSIR